MKSRGAYRVTAEMLAKRLGIAPLIYKVELESTGDVVFYCYDAQESVTVLESEVPPTVRVEDPRFY